MTNLSESYNKTDTNYNIEINDSIFNKLTTSNNNYELADQISNYEDTAKAQIEAENLLNNFNEKAVSRNGLIFKKQKVSLLRIYSHLFEPIDWFFVILALIGGIGAGICQPLLFYMNSKTFSELGNSSEEVISGPPHIVEMIKQIRKESIHSSMNKSIRKQLIFGAISFVCNFLSGTFWMLLGSRISYNLKRRYFALLLAQEQGWFDSFNTYELATKVQSQIRTNRNGYWNKSWISYSINYTTINGIYFRFYFLLK